MMLRYVILHHTGVVASHVDLMFETAPGSALATWRAATWPIGDSPLTPLPDHRRAYLDYEGPIREGRGEVRRLKAGTHQLIIDTPSQFDVTLDTGERLTLKR